MGSSTLAVTGTSSLPPNSNLHSRYKTSRKRIISLLQNCTNANQILQIHAKIIRNGHEQDPFVLFALLRLCSNCNSLDYALKVFEQTENPNVYLYTALIEGHISSESCLDVIGIYSRMVRQSIEPDPYAISYVLKACGLNLALKEGREVHGRVLKLRLYSNRAVRMKLLEFYAKCGEIKDAGRVFDVMFEEDVVASTVMISSYVDHGLIKHASTIFDRVEAKDTVCWTAMIDGLVRNGEMNKALKLFRKMQMENVRPNEVTIVCVISACSQMGTLELGRWVHSYLEKYEIKLNRFVGSALINMYSRCGSLDEAKRVFIKMEERDVVTYNSMIVGLAMHGRSTEAIEMFKLMKKKGLKPSHITFVGVLNACSHGGLVDLGFEIFHSMTEEYRMEPQIEHYGCMVDLLGRVGRLEDAYNFIKEMRVGVAPDHIMWGALLSACKIHRNLELGERVAKILLLGGAADSGTYVLLSNVYASSGKWSEAAQVRAKMKESGIEKELGCSSIEVNNEIHEFLLGDHRHPQREEIYRITTTANLPVLYFVSSPYHFEGPSANTDHKNNKDKASLLESDGWTTVENISRSSLPPKTSHQLTSDRDGDSDGDDVGKDGDGEEVGKDFDDSPFVPTGFAAYRPSPVRHFAG
ncbi:hypothetical protein HHK36_019590 [Tetracentron sinense]|uniref:Pentatricopeptide repeat-containing protein n=1 Tax=Tetracentron sinense TaxID=13715 RepID=A0A834YXT5_TETSI|nr:hypothetical protein HHK36_019590 [Tetracentron sinense]